MTGPVAGHRVIVFLQENKTTDFYFPTLAEWGAVVADHGELLAAPPNFDQPHDRNAWVHYAMGDYPALNVQVDNDTVIPYYSWLAKQFTFCDHHFGLGSNSTSGHMLAIGGQTPTLKNPPFVGPAPTWDLPSIFSVAQAAGVSWGAFPDASGYPTKFYSSLATPLALANIHPPSQFIPMAKAGTLPRICYVWSPAGYDEHPPAVDNPSYVTHGHDLVWQRVQAVIDGGGWANTTFILTWDDWGGYADSVPTPVIETVPDAVHPGGFAVVGGSRIPLLMFGGMVTQGVDSSWHSHASIPRTIIDLLGLPAMGVPRVDNAPTLAARVDPTLHRPTPPAYGSVVIQPAPPTPAPTPVPPAPWGGPVGQPMPALVTLGGPAVPAPSDAVVHPTPPKAPKPPPPAAPLAALVKKAYAGKTAAELAASPPTALKGVTSADEAAVGRPRHSHGARPGDQRRGPRGTDDHPGCGHLTGRLYVRDPLRVGVTSQTAQQAPLVLRRRGYDRGWTPCACARLPARPR